MSSKHLHTHLQSIIRGPQYTQEEQNVIITGKRETRILLASRCLKKGFRYSNTGVKSHAAHAIQCFTELSKPVVNKPVQRTEGQVAGSLLYP